MFILINFPPIRKNFDYNESEFSFYHSRSSSSIYTDYSQNGEFSGRKNDRFEECRTDYHSQSRKCYSDFSTDCCQRRAHVSQRTIDKKHKRNSSCSSRSLSPKLECVYSNNNNNNNSKNKLPRYDHSPLPGPYNEYQNSKMSFVYANRYGHTSAESHDTPFLGAHDDYYNYSQRTCSTSNCAKKRHNKSFYQNRSRSNSDNFKLLTGRFSNEFYPLPLEFWERTDECKQAKIAHIEKVDHFFQGEREALVLLTTLYDEDTVLEKNMFPYDTPRGIEHFTLWSRFELTSCEVKEFVESWLRKHMPQVRRWQYDNNLGDRSIDLFHVHVYIETLPFSFTPRDGLEYKPPNGEFQC